MSSEGVHGEVDCYGVDPISYAMVSLRIQSKDKQRELTLLCIKIPLKAISFLGRSSSDYVAYGKMDFDSTISEN